MLNRSAFLRASLPLFLSFFLFGCGGGNSSSSENDAKAFNSSKEKGGQAQRSMEGEGNARRGRQGSGPSGGAQGGPRGGGPGQGSRSLQGKTNIDVGEEELKTFVEISQEVVPLQRQVRKDQRKAIQESSLSMKRYRQIMMAMRRKQDAGLSQSEKSEVQRLQQEQRKRMKELRQKTRKKVEAKDGLSWERFQKIAQGLSRDKKLKQRFDRMRRQMGGGDAASGGPR